MYKHLTLEQRYQIQALHKQYLSMTRIAEAIGVHKSTVSRELKRNSIQSLRPPDRYKASIAQDFSCKRAYKPWNYKTKDPFITRRIVWLLRQGWSPEQIAHTCRNRGIPMLSTEAIYQWIYQNRVQDNHPDLTSLLRRRYRKRRKRALNRQPRIIIKEKVSIHKRPSDADQYTGHFEADTAKCQNGYLLVLTERRSLFNIIIKMPNKSAQSVLNAIQTIKDKHAILSITSDNGTEFAYHKNITELLQVPWYFADPNSPHQRGKNENQIGIIRQYLTRKTELQELSNQQIKLIEQRINHRPRKKHNFISPIKFLLTKPVALAG
jgi:IS30 family transposase